MITDLHIKLSYNFQGNKEVILVNNNVYANEFDDIVNNNNNNHVNNVLIYMLACIIYSHKRFVLMDQHSNTCTR